MRINPKSSTLVAVCVAATMAVLLVAAMLLVGPTNPAAGPW